MDEMEMPTPCQSCGQLFDLNDGRGSQKWYPGTVICKSCWREEQKEIEEDERWENANNELADALFIFKEEGGSEKLTNENRALIMQLVRLPYPLWSAPEIWSTARQMDSTEFRKYWDGIIKGMQR